MTPQEEMEMATKLQKLRVTCKCQSQDSPCSPCKQKAAKQQKIDNVSNNNTDNDPEGYGSELSFLMTKVQISQSSQNYGGMSYIS